MLDGYDADLFELVELDNYEHVRLFLDSSRPPDVNARDTRGQTVLMVAAYYGHNALLSLLLERGADPNLSDARGETALTKALRHRHAEAARLLRGAGAR